MPVTLNIYSANTAPGFEGTIDTPTDGAVDVTGSVPFTGWALARTEVTRVGICRDPVGVEVPNVAKCGGQEKIYIGDAVFIEGARPDVAAAFPSWPRNGQAGWGFMVLTNMLPAQGNGTYTFWFYGTDAESKTHVIGKRTITCNNAAATEPWGTIDTPLQGETVSNAITNFGWALTQKGKLIPADGSTLMVYVDGKAVAKPSYGYYRPDVATAFPGLANSDGAVGFYHLDTRALANGRHTISWTVEDSQGVISGIGSRYFTVSNSAAKVSAAAVAAHESMDQIQPRPDGLVWRRGWDPLSSWSAPLAQPSGAVTLNVQELDRLELRFPEGVTRAHLEAGTTLGPLPPGSYFDARDGTFVWALGPGFVGSYRLVFVGEGDGVSIRQEIRVMVHEKGPRLPR